eukprot:GHVU01221052.1.p2 GENE.GHVU01221052.1~~GHVU01221052.1.p2  ORF type:complete len:101 (-),score=11.61 GHVU01221052.1:540-842(-)
MCPIRDDPSWPRAATAAAQRGGTASEEEDDERSSAPLSSPRACAANLSSLTFFSAHTISCQLVRSHTHTHTPVHSHCRACYQSPLKHLHSHPHKTGERKE